MKFKGSRFWLIFGLTGFLSPSILSQTTWVVGNKGGIQWNALNQVSSFSFPSAHQTVEGTAVYNDHQGNLQFFCDGKSLRNKNWAITPNGQNLLGDLSSTQAGVFLDFPGDSNKVILLVVDGWGTVGNPANPGDPNTGLTMSVIDKTLDNGRGDIISGQKNIPIQAPIQEKIAVYPKSGCSGYWVVVVGSDGDSDTFFSYSIDSLGLNLSNVVVSPVGYAHTSPIGEMEISPDGQYLAYNCWLNNIVGLFDFNANTGQISNPRRFDSSNNLGTPYGVEFSPNGQYLYVSGNYWNNAIFRFSLPQLTDFQIFSNQSTQGYDYGLLTTGPDGKIYMGRGGKSYISAISTPNLSNPGYVDQAISLSTGNTGTVGLPTTFRALKRPVLKSISVTPLSKCLVPIPVQFGISDSLGASNPFWNFGNGNSDSHFNTRHNYPQGGNFGVTLSYTDAQTGCPVILKDSLKLNAPLPAPPVLANEIRDTCLGKSTLFFSISDSLRWANSQWQSSTAPSDSGLSYFFQAGEGPYSASGHWTDTAGCIFSWSNSNAILPYPILPDEIRIDTIRLSSFCDPNPRYLFRIEDSTLFRDFNWSLGLIIGKSESFSTFISSGTLSKIVLQVNTHLGNCPRRDSISIMPFTGRLAPVPLQPEVKLVACQNTNSFLTFKKANRGTEFTWDFGTNYPKINTGPNDTILPIPYSEPGTYSIRLVSRESFDCFRMDSIEIEIPNVLIPNVITKNGDGKNEHFSLPFPNDVNKVEVYNRWGNRIFESTENLKMWNPMDESEGTYFYHLTYFSGISCGGWILLAR